MGEGGFPSSPFVVEMCSASGKRKRTGRKGEERQEGRREGKKKGRKQNLRPLGNRTPDSYRYRCFLSDLAGLAARPPSGSRYAYEAMITIAGEEGAVNRQGKGLLRPEREGGGGAARPPSPKDVF